METSEAPSGPGLFYWAGLLTVAYIAFRVLYHVVNGIRLWVVGDPKAVGPHLGAWAVITGATDGIGKSYTEELARRGMKVALISRSQEKLDQVASEISEKFKVETKTIVADFEDREAIYDKIKEGLEGLEIGILVNNVGASYSYPQYFLEIPDLDKAIDRLININVLSVCKLENIGCRGSSGLYGHGLGNVVPGECLGNVVPGEMSGTTLPRPRPYNPEDPRQPNLAIMTRLVLPRMLERSKGVIVNISSFAGYNPVPFVTLYSATKAFVDFFSRGLNAEYKKHGVIVQSVQPYLVMTKMTKIRRQNLFITTPEIFVKYALNTVGLETQTSGYPSHSLVAWFSRTIPKWYRTKLLADICLKARAHNLKKLKEN